MNFKALIAGFFFALVWSSAFTVAKITILDSPPIFILSMRFLCAGIVGVGLAFTLGQRLIFTSKEWHSIILFGICQNAIYLGLNYIAMQWINASVASIIASLLPIIVATIYWVFFNEKINKFTVLGLILGFSGVLVIMSSRTSNSYDFLGILLCVIAVLALAMATITVQRSVKKNILMVVGLQMLVGFISLFPISFFIEDWSTNISERLIISFAYIVFIPGLLATLIWFWLIQNVGATKASTFHFLNPFFGVLFASVILSEPVSKFDLIGVFIISIGIISVQISKNYTKNLS